MGKPKTGQRLIASTCGACGGSFPRWRGDKQRNRTDAALRCPRCYDASRGPRRFMCLTCGEYQLNGECREHGPAFPLRGSRPTTAERVVAARARRGDPLPIKFAENHLRGKSR